MSVAKRHIGLGNRVRALLGAKALASATHRRLLYVWPTGRFFEPKLSDLWHIASPELPAAFSRLLSLRYPYLNESLTWLDTPTQEDKVWQIRTGHELALPGGPQAWSEHFVELQPHQYIARRVHTAFQSQLLGAPYYGVMVRAHATSHPTTLESSPVEWYLNRMKTIKSADPAAQFFVSCDVPAVQSRIENEIPNCIGLKDKGEYNSVIGVQNAVADIYLLASASHVIAPHYSSFAELAARMAQGTITLETPATSHGQVPRLDVAPVSNPLRPWIRDG